MPREEVIESQRENIEAPPGFTPLSETIEQHDDINDNIPDIKPVINLSDKTDHVLNNPKEHEEQQQLPDGKEMVKEDSDKSPDGIEQEAHSLDTRLHTALDFYRAEIASLIKRCMLMSGYAPEETEECDEQYLKFVDVALKAENQRVDRLHSYVNHGDL